MFQGPALRSTTAATPILDVETEVEADPDETSAAPSGAAVPTDPDLVEAEIGPMPPIDTTAELLGRAKHRKPRTRALRPAVDAPAAGPKRAAKGGARKAAAPRKPRKKTAEAADE